VEAEEGGEADEYADGKTGRNVGGVTVQRQDGFESLYDFFLIEHARSGCG
jgi:hypothetical protein